MFADNLTIRDLKIFPHPSQQKTIFDVLCYTKTLEGKEQLLKYLRHPCNSEEEVYNFQNLLQSILTSFESWNKFHTLLSSEVFLTVKKQQDNQLLYMAPFIKYTAHRKGQKCSVHMFIETLTEICGEIGENQIISILNKKLSIFKILLTVKYSQKYENWYCYNKHGKEFKYILEDLYKIDALVSIAYMHQKFHFSFPTFTKARSMKIDGLQNILINSSIPNSLHIPADTGTVFLTGANMSGKTTLLLSLGQALYLARCGFGIPATQAELPWFDTIFCAFESNTVIEEGLSYFACEVKRSVEAVKLSGEKGHVLILTDELFKGTNIKDSIDCLSYFTAQIKKSNVTAVISTHLTEFVLEYNKDNALFWCFEGSIMNDQISFDYTLKEGVSTQRLGFKILEKAVKDLG